VVRAATLLCVLAVPACGREGTAMPVAAADAGTPASDGSYPAPREDLVPRLGSEATLDVATWNVENFPRTPASASLLADLIASMDLDLVAMQEVQDIAAWNELIDRLPDHDGVLSAHTYGDGTYQKVGFIYRTDRIQVGTVVLLFDQDGYEFPRPVLQVRMTADDGVHPPLELLALALHLKAGFGAEDRARRELAIAMLEDHVAQTASAGTVGGLMVMGDFNEVITSTGGMTRFAPFLDAPELYDLHTDQLASDGAASFLPSGAILDHIITTASLADEFAGGQDRIPRLDAQFGGYTTSISDHLPVVSSLPIWQ
jgi:endonuclease/exonuclease/phosphatase family metal-dependent hydrolase